MIKIDKLCNFQYPMKSPTYRQNHFEHNYSNHTSPRQSNINKFAQKQVDVRENPIVQTTGHTTSLKAHYFETVCKMFDTISLIFKPSLLVKPGWWYTYFSEYEFVSWDDYSIPNCFWKIIQNFMVPNHQAGILIINH